MMMKTSEPMDAGMGWRLGPDPEELTVDSTSPIGAPAESLPIGLERTMFIVTAEHLAWALIGVWTIVSRLSTLGLAPLNPHEAGLALYSYDLAKGTDASASIGFDPLWGGWIHFLRAGFFAVFGANEITARLPALLAGLLIVAMAFEMRHYIGRAGAIGMGAMLAVSPSFTYLAPAGGGRIVAMALALVTIALFMALKAAPERRRATSLGIAAGLMTAADPIGPVTAGLFALALVLLGLSEVVTGQRAYLRTRVWMTRYGSLAMIALFAAIAAWFGSQILIGFPIDGLSAAAAFAGSPPSKYIADGLSRAGLIFGFYEFLIGIATMIGLVAVIGLRVRDRFAAFCLIWTLLGLGFCVGIPGQPNEMFIMTMLPAAILGGIGIEWLYSTTAWQVARWPAIVLILISVYVQVLTNFVFLAPDASAATWAQHANLYWDDGATTVQAAEECRAMEASAAESNVTIFEGDVWPSTLRWCLREARPVIQRDRATIALMSGGASDISGMAGDVQRVDYEEKWVADASRPDPDQAFKYFFTEQIWGEMTARSVEFRVTPPEKASAPTVIVPPSR
jgi:hypothetical protein